MLIIIGESGMLMEATQVLTKRYNGAVLLCSRDRSPYSLLLEKYPHTQFVPFDFSAESSYQGLGQIVEDQLTNQEESLEFLVWVHSPYYPYLLELLRTVKKSIEVVYLVKGSNSQPLPIELTQDFPLKLIQLGIHPTENRWLTNHEISQQVLGVMLENEEFGKRKDF